MQIFVETPRLLLREITQQDARSMFELDSDPQVHQYLGNQPVTSIDQCRTVIDFIRRQYVETGIGRWAVVLRETNEFIGWAGLKFVRETVNGHTRYYDLGYRFIRRFWGKGYATEAALASLDYGFNQLHAREIFAMVTADNAASRRVLEKTGFNFEGIFDEDGETLAWYKHSR